MGLPEFIRQIEATYAAIARKIEELITILNETGVQKDASCRRLAQRLTSFLTQLEQSINLEESSARRALPPEKRTLFLRSIRQELRKIKELRTYITVSARKPTPAIITKIHHLYQEVEQEIQKQKALAA